MIAANRCKCVSRFRLRALKVKRCRCRRDRDPTPAAHRASGQRGLGRALRRHAAACREAPEWCPS